MRCSVYKNIFNDNFLYCTVPLKGEVFCKYQSFKHFWIANLDWAF